jgi:hypothetical protein
LAICADGDERIPAYPTEVVDTVGAGDAFMTGRMDAHLPSRGHAQRYPIEPLAVGPQSGFKRTDPHVNPHTETIPSCVFRE